MLVLTHYKSLKGSGGCTNTIVWSLGLGLVSKLFEDEQRSKCGVVILGVFFVCRYSFQGCSLGCEYNVGMFLAKNSKNYICMKACRHT